METTFNCIKNRISDHSKDDIISFCYQLMDAKKNEVFPIWFVFIIMKWTMIYGGNRYPPKKLTPEKFNNIYNSVSKLNEGHISSFIKNKQVDRAFQVLFNQQFYLQKSVYREIFSSQLKLFTTIRGKYDIDKSFKEKTGIAIFDFLFLAQIVWLYINISELKDPQLYFEGYLDSDFLKVATGLTSEDNVKKFLNLLMVHSFNEREGIENFRHKMNNENFQTMEMSFFTMFPFHLFQGRIKLVHPAVFQHSVNYYIYDFLKASDENFTTEFGYRLEKFIEFGLKEMNLDYRTENDLKKQLGKNSSLVDYVVQNENIYIESKATELQAYPSVNPTDELLYNALKTSIFKAYFKQLTKVAQHLTPGEENWGIIITYKEFFWSHFSKLYDVGKEYYTDETGISHLPPENVFIIDIYSWNLIVQLVKDKKTTLPMILQKAKEDNSRPETSKQLFGMHLDIFAPHKLDLQYLKTENKEFDLNVKHPLPPINNNI